MSLDPGRSSRGRGNGGSSTLKTILAYELRMLLRDTRTVLIAVVAPLVLFPAFILINNWVESRDEERLEEATYRYAVTGEEAAWARARVEEALALDAADPDTTRRPATFREETVGRPDSVLKAGDLHLVVEGLSAEAYMAGADSGDARAPVPALEIRYRAQSDFSRAARSRLQDRLGEVRARQRDSIYRARGFPVSLERVAVVEEENVASAAREAGALLGLALTPLLLLLMLSGGSIVAADAISGEKERGTLETLLTTAAPRRTIVQAKLLAVLVVGLAVALVNVANLAVYLGLGVLDLPTSLQVSLGAGEIGALLLLFIPLAVLVSASLLLLSGVSKSYKEYQIYFFPVFLVFLLPSLAAILPGVELRSVIAFIPVAGIAVAVKEILVGDVDWLFSGVAFASTSALALGLVLRTETTLSNERLISSSGPDEAEMTGGAALFPRQVLRWFLGLWVLFFVASLWLGDSLGIRGQVLVNLVAIFFGGSLFIMWRYRLPVKETLSLRMPHPAAWGAAVLGAPSALVLGVSLAELVNRFVFPVPQEVLESFGQSLAGPELPLWQLVLFICVMPGLFEEIAFRGVLLHGLRQRMKPWIAILVTGAVFGFFHVSLFRIAPTAWLGVILALSVVLSGSILPAMLWHFLNNAIAIVPDRAGWIPDDFTVQPWWASAAAAGLAVSLWILYRTGPRPESAAGPWESRGASSP